VTRARGSRSEGPRPCCMISEILEDAGIDREKLRQVQRQVLEGVILMCQWQLERLEAPRPRRRPSKKARKVVVE
jgi:hypothetical protein